ncbi:amidohydrolase family protein [Edaphobacter sp. 12200R-103]|uniref:amidohydrolase family protein n=1 Tax=Edaphobacter sp. 12200R-103 TaxID=2703788 RepID=UPI00138CE876|nr:amidohydrolase family protein [Edaphobacter sp. 12200R-103]QHS51656.1 amidohydrolase family protein [Edaphobacter sp. 12200R-103]
MRIIACALMFSAAIAATAQQKPIILHDAALVDGTGAPVRPHVDITLHKGYIDSVKPAFKEAPKDAEIVDCTGKTVIPGLISAHSHLGILLDNATPSPNAYTTENVTKALDQFERYGVTTIVSLGVNRDLVYQLRDQQRNSKLGGATILTAGRGIGVPNGAPGLNVASDQIYRPGTPDEARKDVDDLAKNHADLVKIWLDSGHGKIPPMKPEIYTAVIEQAHKHHMKVAAHVYTLADAKSLVSADVDIFAHSIRDQAVDPGFAQTLIDHKIWYIPTLTLDEAFYLYAQNPDVMHSAFFQQAAGAELLAKLQAPGYAEKTLASAQTEQAKKDHEIAMKNLKTLYDAGVNIGFGTDSGAVPGRIPGFSEHRELEDLVAAGLTPLQAITLATGENGRLLHEVNSKMSIGLIKNGYSADLIILSADPLMDVRNTRKIVAVYHHGVLVPNTPPQN